MEMGEWTCGGEGKKVSDGGGWKAMKNNHFAAEPQSSRLKWEFLHTLKSSW